MAQTVRETTRMFARGLTHAIGIVTSTTATTMVRTAGSQVGVCRDCGGGGGLTAVHLGKDHITVASPPGR